MAIIWAKYRQIKHNLTSWEANHRAKRLRTEGRVCRVLREDNGLWSVEIVGPNTPDRRRRKKNAQSD